MLSGRNLKIIVFRDLLKVPQIMQSQYPRTITSVDSLVNNLSQIINQPKSHEVI